MTLLRLISPILILSFLGAVSTPVEARSAFTDLLTQAIGAAHAATDRAPAESAIEVGFSPEGSAERLVLKVINSSQKSIRLMGYSFTSPKVVQALIGAKRRGVDVKVVVDEKGNLKGERNAGRHALKLLDNAGIDARTSDKYAILHDKVIVSDLRHVQTGSFNYSKAAASSNSENVLVLWNHPDLATQYQRHWESRYTQGRPFTSSY